MKNNPLNIRKSSEKFLGEIESNNSFKDFSSKEFGYRAAFKILGTYIEKYKIDTLDKIITRWAPPNENDTKSYIKFVCDKTDFYPPKKFTKYDKELIPLVYAMAWIENGIKPNLFQIENAFLIINAKSVKDATNLLELINNVHEG